MEEGSFDTIICNSVAQYFPNIEYLKDVVVRAVKLLRAGGHIFLGDIRSLVLLKHFHSSMELHKAHGDLRGDELERRISNRMMSEKELLVDPAFFFALKEEIPEIANVEILTKTGRSLNELTQYRYQVVIRVGVSEDSQAIADWVDYQTSEITLDEIKQTLESGQREYFAVENIINSRLTREVTLVKLLEMEESHTLSASNIRAQLEALLPSGVEVDDILSIGKGAGYNVHISWSRQQNDGCFDVIFTQIGLLAPQRYNFKEPNYSLWKWKSYGNNPMHEVVNKQFVPRLLDHLRTILPKYMVPNSMIILESLPVMLNGKVNRLALPIPSSHQFGANSNYVEPGTMLEKTLERIFSEVLGFERTSIHDNFFDLGGHSLSATKVISRIRMVLQQEVPLKFLFEAPTIASLSERLEILASESIRVEGPIPKLSILVEREQLPLSFAQERLWFMNELIPDSYFYNMPLALTLTGELNVGALKQSIVDIIVRHESLRTTFALSGNEPVQVIKPANKFSLSFDEYYQEDDTEALETLVFNEFKKPFDLVNGPLIRVKLIHVTPRKYIFVVVTHHIIFDGWSYTIFQKELSALYESNTLGKPSHLPDLTIQYVDFAVWQRNWLQGDNLDIQMNYWKKHLKNMSTLTLATDFIRPAVLSYQANVQEMSFSSAFTSQLKELSKMEASTLHCHWFSYC
ncbi:hypothetical protein K7432_017374 [Basidiobolus ranarum]|uniref:Carrier domain-containing protein n=1 Tax=Basidiobolus ranarum TaxID=34480 RepID=A0ABR2VKJ8_9FUNG